MMPLNRIRDMIRRHEGYRDAIYRDTEGNMTVGVGRCLRVGQKVPGEVLEDWFNDDLFRARHDAETLGIYAQLPTLCPVRTAVLVDMIFNMGLRGVKGFKKMLSYLRRSNFDGAADEMMDSKWARQVGKDEGERAWELARMMRSGQWPEDT